MARTKIDAHAIETAEELAEQGAGTSVVAEALNVHPSTCSRNRQIRNAIQRGRAKARRRILENFQTMMETEPSLLTEAARRLGVFRDSLPVTKPKSPKEAAQALTEIFALWIDGKASDSAIKTAQSWARDFSRIYEVADLDERLKRVEAMLDRLEKENAEAR